MSLTLIYDANRKKPGSKPRMVSGEVQEMITDDSINYELLIKKGNGRLVTEAFQKNALQQLQIQKMINSTEHHEYCMP